MHISPIRELNHHIGIAAAQVAHSSWANCVPHGLGSAPAVARWGPRAVKSVRFHGRNGYPTRISKTWGLEALSQNLWRQNMWYNGANWVGVNIAVIHSPDLCKPADVIYLYSFWTWISTAFGQLITRSMMIGRFNSCWVKMNTPYG